MSFEQFEIFTFISDYKNVYCGIFVVFCSILSINLELKNTLTFQSVNLMKEIWLTDFYCGLGLL